MNKHIALGLAFLFIQKPAWAAEPLGMIKKLKGPVFVTRADKEGAAKEGLVLFSGDKIRTEKDARVQLVMKNQKILFLGSSSEMAIKTDASDEKGDATLNVGVAYGKLRAIIGGKKDGDKSASNYKLKVYSGTTVAGVRGTKFGVVVQDGASSIYNLNSEANSLDYTVRGGARDPQAKPTTFPVPPGSFSSLAQEGKKPLPPTTIQANQFNSMIAYDIDGTPIQTNIDRTGLEQNIRGGAPLGAKAFMEPVEPALLPNNMIAPPPGFKLEIEGKNAHYLPYFERTLAVNATSGDFYPVVSRQVSGADAETLGKLLNNPTYRKQMAQLALNQSRVNQLTRQLISARTQNNKETAGKIEAELKTTQSQILKAQKIILQAQARIQHSYLEKITAGELLAQNGDGSTSDSRFEAKRTELMSDTVETQMKLIDLQQRLLDSPERERSDTNSGIQALQRELEKQKERITELDTQHLEKQIASTVTEYKDYQSDKKVDRMDVLIHNPTDNQTALVRVETGGRDKTEMPQVNSKDLKSAARSVLNQNNIALSNKSLTAALAQEAMKGAGEKGDAAQIHTAFNDNAIRDFCSQHAGDVACMSGIGDDRFNRDDQGGQHKQECSANPTLPFCHGDSFRPQEGCSIPGDPACQPPDHFCPNGQCNAPPPCMLNPNLPGCGGPGFCQTHPCAPGCPGPNCGSTNTNAHMTIKVCKSGMTCP